MPGKLPRSRSPRRSVTDAARFTDWAQVPAAPTAEMLAKPWFLEVFSGKAWLTRAMRKRGWNVLPPIDIVIEGDVLAAADVCDPALCSKVEAWLSSGCVKFVHFGTPCTTHVLVRRETAVLLLSELTSICLESLDLMQQTRRKFASALCSRPSPSGGVACSPRRVLSGPLRTRPRP